MGKYFWLSQKPKVTARPVIMPNDVFIKCLMGFFPSPMSPTSGWGKNEKVSFGRETGRGGRKINDVSAVLTKGRGGEGRGGCRLNVVLSRQGEREYSGFNIGVMNFKFAGPLSVHRQKCPTFDVS